MERNESSRKANYARNLGYARRRGGEGLPEYFISILNWPIEANNPEDAARSAYRSLKEDPTGFRFTVTEEEGTFGDITRVEFDTYDFEDTPDE